MKKILLLTVISLISSVGFSQLQPLSAVIIDDLSTNTMAAPKSTTCGLDTVQYPTAKATGLSALSINSATSAQALCQYYNAPQAITISGAEFYAYKLDATGGTSINVTLAVYAAGPDSMPTGAALASVLVPVDTTFGGGALSVLQKVGTFSPITMTVPYCVVVSNVSANGVGMISNDYTAADGQQEWLSSADLFGTWTRSWGLNVGGTLYDADFVVHPIVSYDLDAAFTVDDPCFGLGLTLNFTNGSSPVTNDRMYNQAAYLGLTELSYTWNYGDASPTENFIDATHTYAAASGYTVTLTDTIFGWTANCSTDTMVTLGLAPVAAYSSVAAGFTATFTNTSTSGSGTTYVWDFGDGNTSSLSDPMHTYAAAGTYTVCLIVLDDCGADSTCQSVTITCATPIPDFGSLSSGLSVDFTNTSTVGTSPSYLWDFGDGNTSTLSDPTHIYAAGGTYTVCLTVSDVCGTDSSCQSVVVSDCTIPTVSFTTVNNDPSYDFTNTSVTTGSATYSWDMGDGNGYSTMDASHTYTANGTYVVTLVVTDSCGVDSTSQSITIATIGLDDLSLQNVELFPNPTKGEFTIHTTVDMESIEVLDMTGKFVVRLAATGTEVKVNGQHLADGNYIVRVRQSDGTTLQSRLEIAK
jgi:PKD repeat protein